MSESERVGGDNMIYKPLGENVPDMVYLGSLASFDLAYAWAQDKCVPLVREITFENGEVGSRRSRPRWRRTPTRSHLSVLFQELTEEGLPFLILFHINDDTESLEKFQQEVARQLISEKGPYSIYLLRSQTKHVHNVGFSFLFFFQAQ